MPPRLPDHKPRCFQTCCIAWLRASFRHPEDRSKGRCSGIAGMRRRTRRNADSSVSMKSVLLVAVALEFKSNGLEGNGEIDIWLLGNVPAFEIE